LSGSSAAHIAKPAEHRNNHRQLIGASRAAVKAAPSTDRKSRLAAAVSQTGLIEKLDAVDF
jgi:hypothetical protein